MMLSKNKPDIYLSIALLFYDQTTCQIRLEPDIDCDFRHSDRDGALETDEIR